jgi:hypothetical protein
MTTKRKLGRKAVLTDSRTLKLARYMPPVPAPPAARDWSKGITSFGQLLNDSLGDCTIAAVGHAVQIFTANVTSEASITDAMALQYYEQWDGYNPADPSTDQGGICLDVLKDWQQNTFAGHRILAFASALPGNPLHIKEAINLFGGVYIGFNMPQFAMPPDGSLPAVWDATPTGDNTIIGGHCVFVCAYDASGLTCVTWGQLQRMTWAFWAQFVDEAYCVISPDFINKHDLSPSGFNLNQLLAELVEIN